MCCAVSRNWIKLLKTRKQLYFLLCKVNLKKNSALWQHPTTYLSLQEMQVQLCFSSVFLFCWDWHWLFWVFFNFVISSTADHTAMVKIMSALELWKYFQGTLICLEKFLKTTVCHTKSWGWYKKTLSWLRPVLHLI